MDAQARTRTRSRAEILPAIEEVLRLDREVFGADRSGLLGSLTLSRRRQDAAPGFTLAARRGAGIDGYGLADGVRSPTISGPGWLRTEDVAATLLDEFLSRSGRELVFVDSMLENPWALSLLKARGFEFRGL